MFSRFSTKLYRFSQAKASQDSLVTLTYPKPQIAKLTLNNPAKRNVLSMATLKHLDQLFKQLSGDFQKTNSPGIIILASTGTVFSSGHDLGELVKFNQEQRQALFQFCSEICVSIRNIPQPVIAEIDGTVAAAGVQLALSCDLVTATSNSRFSCPGVKLGIFCTTPGVALARANSSTKKSLELLLTGDFISAQEAQSYGMVNKVVDQKEGREGLEKATLELADRILSNNSKVFTFGKQKFYEQIAEEDLAQAYKKGTLAMVENLDFPECNAGLKGFLEKKHTK